MSVCKAWKSLINCSEFVSRHIVLPANRLLVGYPKDETFEENYVCFVDDDTFPQQKLHPAFPPLLQLLENPTIIGTSCGLFCFYGFPHKPEVYDNQIGMCVLWNPSIRKSVGVVVPNHPFNGDIGFGVCPYTKDPKIVKILYSFDDKKKLPFQVMVFTLSSGEWRCLGSNKRLPFKSNLVVGGQKVVIGQYIYWLAFDRKNRLRRKVIMSFDLSTHEFTEVDLPDSLRESDFFIYRLRECLVLLVDNSNIYTQVCDVWMMGDGDRKVFTKVYTIKAPDVMWIAGFRKIDEPIIQRRHGLPGELVVYEPCSEHIKVFGIYGTGQIRFVYSYMESLLLLDHDDGHVVSLRCGTMKS